MKSSLVTYGFNDYTDAQKACYLIDGIKTANLETCIETITTKDALREDLAALISHYGFPCQTEGPKPQSQHLRINTGQGGGRGKSG